MVSVEVRLPLRLLLLVLPVALLSAGLLPLRSGSAARERGLPNLTRYVDPFIGTAGDGNVFPGADMPFGMVQWSPDSSAGGLVKPSGYNDGDLILSGFSLTHLSGAGCVAFGNVPFMPTVRPMRSAREANGSPYSDRFDRSSEQASPGYYGVTLASGIHIQLSVTTRTGLGRFTFPRARRASVLIASGAGSDATSNTGGADDARVEIRGKNTVTGWASSGHFCGLPNRFRLYFAVQFDRPFRSFGTWTHSRLSGGSRHTGGNGSGAYVQFDTRRNAVVQARVGLSHVSEGNAALNLRRESRGRSFNAIRGQADVAWNRMLNRVQVQGGTASEKRSFYTALYHSLLQPSTFSDVNGQYIGFDGAVHRASGWVQYANISGWDIYRSEIPLLAWLFPTQAEDIVQSMVEDARQGGWLPKWPAANDYTGEMNGDSADPIIAGAYAFGARDFDRATALRYMLKGANNPGPGPKGYLERPGLASYLRWGYMTSYVNGWGPAATTLEYTTDDFCIAQFAKALHQKGVHSTFTARAAGWRKLFDPRTHFIEPRSGGGGFPRSFNHSSMDGFVEGNAWQYTWMVPYDLKGLFGRMGGGGSAADRLDHFFRQLNAGPTRPYHWGGNEPGMEIPWEYDFAGRPWRTQDVVRRIMTQLYPATRAGLPGDDDLGALSSWYVWAAIGLYPEIPGVGGFALGSPLFPRISLHLPKAGSMTVIAPGAAANHPYVRSLQLDGREYSRTWLPLSVLKRHAVLRFSLGSHPNRGWGHA